MIPMDRHCKSYTGAAIDPEPFIHMSRSNQNTRISVNSLSIDFMPTDASLQSTAHQKLERLEHLRQDELPCDVTVNTKCNYKIEVPILSLAVSTSEDPTAD